MPVPKLTTLCSYSINKKKPSFDISSHNYRIETGILFEVFKKCLSATETSLSPIKIDRVKDSTDRELSHDQPLNELVNFIKTYKLKDPKDTKIFDSIFRITIRYGLIEKTGILEKEGIQIDISKALEVAIQSDNTEMVKNLLKFLDTNFTNKKNKKLICENAFFLASLLDRTEIVQIMLNHGVDINTTTASSKNITALILAAECGHEKTVEMLLNNGATQITSAMAKAISNGHIQTLKTIITAIPDINLINQAVMHAIQERKIDIVEMLLNNGANRNYTTKTADYFRLYEEETFLTKAASINCSEITRLLLEKFPNNNVYDSNQEKIFALRNALLKNSFEAAIVLLENGANVNDDYPLIFFETNPTRSHPEIGHSVSMKMCTLLGWAITSDNHRVLRFLLANKADTEKKRSSL